MSTAVSPLTPSSVIIGVLFKTPFASVKFCSLRLNLLLLLFEN